MWTNTNKSRFTVSLYYEHTAVNVNNKQSVYQRETSPLNFYFSDQEKALHCVRHDITWFNRYMWESIWSKCHKTAQFKNKVVILDNRYEGREVKSMDWILWSLSIGVTDTSIFNRPYVLRDMFIRRDNILATNIAAYVTNWAILKSISVSPLPHCTAVTYIRPL